MKNIYYLIIICLFSISGCATTSSYRSLESNEGERELIIPAGIDSLTAVESNDLADSSFVSYEKQQEAEVLKRQADAYRAESNELWEVLAMESTDADNSDTEDDPEFVESFNEGASSFTEARQLSQSSDLSDEDLNRYDQLITDAINSFEEALQLNPYDNQTRLVLAQLYGAKASRLNQENEYRKAIDILEKLVRIEKGQHVVYASLGENYFLAKNFELAADNFENAFEVLIQTIPLSDYYYENQEYSPEDSLNAFSYKYNSGEAYIELFESENALASLNEAKSYTYNEEYLAAIESQIEFVNWDDGNILGSMRRDSLANLVANDQLNEAESGFLELLNNLKTESAQNEIAWRLAVVQYQLGKEEQGAERLLDLVQKLETNQNGEPLNQDHQRYFEDFGTILYNMGTQYLDENNNRAALTYFNQSTKVKWANRARSHLRIADLLQNNVPEALQHAQLAENEAESLSDNDRKALYSLLMNFHRSNGDLDLARNYQQLWREL